MSLIVDASVAVKWLLQEEGSERARDLAGDDDLRAPDLILAETFNAIWKRWRRGEATADQLSAALPSLIRTLDLVPLPDLVEAAAKLSQQLRHPIYDCVYLAAALASGLPLVTADERQFAMARQARVNARLL
jgi:predicted nucleic acid-binding protein